MTDLMKALKVKGPDSADYTDEIKLLDEEIAQITGILQKQIDNTASGIAKAADEICLCIELIK